MSAVPTLLALPGEPQVSGVDALVCVAQQAVRPLAAVAALICEAPFASISLPGAEITWSRAAELSDRTALPDHRRFDAYTLRGAGLFEVPDAAADERFASS